MKYAGIMQGIQEIIDECESKEEMKQDMMQFIQDALSVVQHASYNQGMKDSAELVEHQLRMKSNPLKHDARYKQLMNHLVGVIKAEIKPVVNPMKA